MDGVYSPNFSPVLALFVLTCLTGNGLKGRLVLTGEVSGGGCEGDNNSWAVAVVGVEAAEKDIAWLWVGVVEGVSTGVTAM